MDSKGLRVPMMGAGDSGRLESAMEEARRERSGDAVLHAETTANPFLELGKYFADNNISEEITGSFLYNLSSQPNPKETSDAFLILKQYLENNKFPAEIIIFILYTLS